MKVILLAGGFGTRLSEYTDTIPKPMVEIGGKVGDIDLVHRELIDNSLSSYPMRQIKILNSYLLMNGEKSDYGASVREMYDEIRSELLKPVADYLDESEMIP